MIEVRDLWKRYAGTDAVREMSFEVSRGEVVGFLGPNGAGKTTTLRILAGFLGATRGSVRIAGHDVFEQPILARRRLGYMPENCPVYPEMRVREYLTFRAQLKGLAARERRAAVAAVMQRVAVAERAEALLGHLSKGYRQRVGLADALLGSPELLILDEPTSGLDPNQIRDVRALIQELASAHTVLLSTHILAEVERTCGRALVIHEGRLVASGSLDELKQQRIHSTALLSLRGGERSAFEPHLELMDLLDEDAQQRVRRWRVRLGSARLPGIDDWVSLASSAGCRVLEATPEKPTLEEVFTQLTQNPEAK